MTLYTMYLSALLALSQLLLTPISAPGPRPAAADTCLHLLLPAAPSPAPAQLGLMVASQAGSLAPEVGEQLELAAGVGRWGESGEPAGGGLAWLGTSRWGEQQQYNKSTIMITI